MWPALHKLFNFKLDFETHKCQNVLSSLDLNITVRTLNKYRIKKGLAKPNTNLRIHF